MFLGRKQESFTTVELILQLFFYLSALPVHLLNKKYGTIRTMRDSCNFLFLVLLRSVNGMLSIDEIKQLIELIDESTLDEFELETKDSKILLKKHKTVVATAVQEAPIAVAPRQTAPVTPRAAPQVEASTAEDVNLEVITSPMVGTFYASASPEDANFVSVGSKVSAQSVVCIVEAMKLFNEITADIDGEIAEILVSSGELVEFGQPLFKVRKK